MSAHGDRQHAADGRGTPPQAVPPIRNETQFLDETLEQGLDAFDSEVSLGMLGRRARVEGTSDLDLFPSEQVAAHHVAAGPGTGPVPETVVAPRAVVAADRHVAVVSTAPGAVAVPPERPAVVTAIPRRAPVLTTRRLAVVAGIFGGLGLTTLGVLLMRSPAAVVAPPPVVRDVISPPAASEQRQAPIPTLPTTSTAAGPTTLESVTTLQPGTTPEPLMSSEVAPGSRGPTATPASAAVAPPQSPAPTPRPEPLIPGPRSDTSERTGVLLSAENAETSAERGLADQKMVASLPGPPVSVDYTSPVNTPAAPLPPAPAMLPPAAPVSAPAVAGAGSATAVTMAPAPARDAADIQTVLTRYRSAFSDLDAAAVSQVWPNADSRSLARAFRGLEEQGISFDDCDIQVTGTSAAASCDGTVRYVTRVGSKDPRTEQRRWQFTLGKVRDLWMIQTVESR